MGPCAGEGCDRQIYRGDIFFTPLSGGIYCLDCWEKAPGVDREMHRHISAAIEAVSPVPTSAPVQPEKREQVWDGEFPQ